MPTLRAHRIPGVLSVIRRLATSPGSRKPTLIKVPAKGQEEEQVPKSTLMEYRGAVVDGCEMSLLPRRRLNRLACRHANKKQKSLIFAVFYTSAVFFCRLFYAPKIIPFSFHQVACNLRNLRPRLLASVNHIPSLAPPGGRLQNSSF